MKQLLLILSILLTYTAAQAQRYRLVADTVYDYRGWERVGEDVTVNVYQYSTDTPSSTTGSRYDTMYTYKPQGDSLYLKSFSTQRYNTRQQLLATTRYEQVLLRSPDTFLHLRYYKDGAYLPVYKDSLVYHKANNEVKKQLLYSTKGMFGCGFANSMLPYEYTLPLRLFIKSKYKGRRLVKTKEYRYNAYEKRMLWDEKRYKYNQHQQRIRTKIYTRAWGTKKSRVAITDYTYNDTTLVNTTLCWYKGLQKNECSSADSTQHYTANDRRVDSTWRSQGVGEPLQLEKVTTKELLDDGQLHTQTETDFSYGYCEKIMYNYTYNKAGYCHMLEVWEEDTGAAEEAEKTLVYKKVYTYEQY